MTQIFIITLSSIHNDGYLDGDSGVLRDGAKVQTWSSQGSGKHNQQWFLREVGNNVYNLINMHNGGYLDVDKDASRDGAKVQTWGSQGIGKLNQQWRLHHVGNDAYNLISVHNGGYLDVDFHSSINGAKVQTWSSQGKGRINQQWFLKKHELKIDFFRAIQAFAVNFPNKIKRHTLGRLEENRGILFHTERIINNKLWLYEAFPKSDRNTFPTGYQHVWNGVILEKDGYISTDCTIPYKQQGALWLPPIPRIHRYQSLGNTAIETKKVNYKDIQISYPSNEIVSTSSVLGYGTIYPPKMLDLSDSASEENMGVRWVLTIAVGASSERWSIDLGPEEGVFQPRYGIVGYHANWDDERYFANIQTEDILEDRRHDGTPQNSFSS